jgi:hypothetical protein
MSAGDVKFIGWTGTNPHYQELPPDISYEPLTGRRNFFAKPEDPLLGIPRVDTENYLIKRITRRLVCFEKDKNQVIGLLKFSNAQFSLPFVNASGQQENVDMGGGWRLLNIADARYRVGYSIITATYTKVAFAGFEFGVPPDYKVTCENGVASIMYKNTVLEEIDSGTGVCGIPLDVVIDTKATQIIVPRRRERNPEWQPGRTDVPPSFEILDEPIYKIFIPGEGVVESDDADVINNATFAEIYLTSNGVVVDKTVVLGKDLPSRLTEVTTKTSYFDESDITYTSPSVLPGLEMRTEYANGIAETEIWLAERRISQAKIDEIKAEYATQYPDTEFTSYRFDVVQRESISAVWNRWRVTSPGTVAAQPPSRLPIIFTATSNVTVNIIATKKLPATTFPAFINWNVTESDGKTTLKLGNNTLTLREYDVTGLT